MALVTGGELVGRTLSQAGVKNVYVLYGGHLDPICASVRKHGIKYVDVRNEVSAGYAAEGFARADGSFGVALLSAAPGYTNVLTSMTNAYIDRTPVVYISASAALADAETNNFMSGFDPVAMAKPVTKWAHCVTRTCDIPRLLAQAIRIATSAPTGPVLLDIPMDVVFAAVEESIAKIPQNILRDEPAVPRQNTVEDAIKLLASAKRPIIMLGEGASRSRAASELRAFVEMTGIPVYSDYQGYGLLPTRHPLFVGSLLKLTELVGTPDRPDVVLALGVRFGFMTVGPARLVPPEAKVIHVDVDPKEIDRTREVEVAMVANSREALLALNAHAATKTWPDWSDWQTTLQRIKAERPVRLAKTLEGRSAGPIPPYQAALDIVDSIGEDACVVVDGADAHQWIAEVLQKDNPYEFFSHASHFGCLGYGLGFSMGLQNARPNKRVVLISGDGALGFNIIELHTLARHKLPILVIVMNNRAWGATSHFQDGTFGPDNYFGVDLSGAAYHEIAAGFGCHSAHVTKIEQLKPAIAAALASGRPACINVEIEVKDVPPDSLALQFLHS